MPSTERLPLIVLAGHDPRPAVLPESGADKHPLVGFKGLDVQIEGQPLVDVLLDRLEDCGAFGPIYLAGPRAAYGERRGSAAVIDTEGSFGHNIAAALEEVTARHPGAEVALTTCDIVPEPADLLQAVEDYRAESPLDFWFAMIAIPSDPEALGASSWKPQYRVAPAPGEDPVSVLPGHLLFVQPDACRVPLVLRAFDIAYGTRNRPILARLVRIVGGLLGRLILADLRGLFRFEAPLRTVSVVVHAIALALRLRSGEADAEQLARHARALFVRRGHRRRHPDLGGRFVVLEAVSLAKDIDTEEEAAELAHRMRLRRGRRGGRRRAGRAQKGHSELAATREPVE